MKNEKLLNEIGLNETATKLYLQLLEDKKSTILDLSRTTGIARTSIYNNIELLKKWSLVGEAIEGSKKYLYAESPENLINAVKMKEKLAMQAAEMLLPTFERNDNDFTIKFYNFTDLKKIGDEMLKTKNKEILHLVNHSFFQKILKEKYVGNYQDVRNKKGIEAKILLMQDNLPAIKNQKE